MSNFWDHFSLLCSVRRCSLRIKKNNVGMIILDFLYCFRSLEVEAVKRKYRNVECPGVNIVGLCRSRTPSCILSLPAVRARMPGCCCPLIAVFMCTEIEGFVIFHSFPSEEEDQFLPLVQLRYSLHVLLF